MTGTMTILLLTAILLGAAMICRLGKRPARRAGDTAPPPPPDPTRGFRDPSP